MKQQNDCSGDYWGWGRMFRIYGFQNFSPEKSGLNAFQNVEYNNMKEVEF